MPAGDGLDAEGLRGYRIGLAVSARRFRRMEAGWRGTAEVRIGVTAAGLALPPELVRPSGQAALDAAALEMMGRAAAATALPDSLRGRAFAVSLPVEFSPD